MIDESPTPFRFEGARRATADLAPLRARFDAVLVDLDGTLLHPDGHLTARTWRAVRRLREAGFQVVLCTGRSLAGILSIHRGLGLDTPIAAYNGGWIGRPGRRPWRYLPIPDTLVGVVARLEFEADFSFRHAGNRKLSVTCAHPLYRRVSAWYENVVHVGAEDDLPSVDVMRVSCYFDGPGRVEAAWETLAPHARKRLRLQHYPLRIFRRFEDTDLHLGEVQLRTRGKAEIYGVLEEILGIPASRTVAIGDQRNDRTLLAGAGFAVCVANAVEEVKALADLVIPSNEEDGIAAWIEAGAPLDGAGRRWAEAAIEVGPPEGIG
ncbi:MAG: HAD family hydrolase [Planctomycetota bacterium]